MLTPLFSLEDALESIFLRLVVPTRRDDFFDRHVHASQFGSKRDSAESQDFGCTVAVAARLLQRTKDHQAIQLFSRPAIDVGLPVGDPGFHLLRKTLPVRCGKQVGFDIGVGFGSFVLV